MPSTRSASEQKVPDAADRLEAELAVELLRPVVGRGDDEVEVAPGRERVLEGAPHDRLCEPATSVPLEGHHALDLPRAGAEKELAVARDHPVHPRGEVPDFEGLAAPVLRGDELPYLLFILDLRTHAFDPERLELGGVDLLHDRGVHFRSPSAIGHHEQLLGLPAERPEVRRDPLSQVVVDGDLSMRDPCLRECGIGFLDQLFGGRLGTQVDREMVSVVDEGLARGKQCPAVRGRNDSLYAPLVEAPHELDRVFELPHSSLLRWPSTDSSAMSRRKNSETVQSATTRSFRESRGSWYRW